MKIKKTAIYILALCLIMPLSQAYAEPIDIEAMDFVFERFEGLTYIKKAMAYQYMEGAMNNENSLENFKGTADWLLNEERLALLEKNGIDRSDIMENLDALKTWTREDRLSLVDAFKQKDREDIRELNEKYTRKDMFTDMDGHWAIEAVEEMATLGIIKGRGNGIFDPDSRVSRAEFAAIMVRLAETKKPLAESPALLRDIPSGSWYESPIRKAYKAGILSGDGKGKIRPGEGISRQEMAVMAVNLSNSIGKSLPQPANLLVFSDRASIAWWAKKPVATAKAAGWIKGMGNGRMNPADTVTRAQAVALIKRINNYIN